jgi:hypothetical protein
MPAAISVHPSIPGSVQYDILDRPGVFPFPDIAWLRSYDPRLTKDLKDFIENGDRTWHEEFLITSAGPRSAGVSIPNYPGSGGAPFVTPWTLEWCSVFLHDYTTPGRRSAVREAAIEINLLIMWNQPQGPVNAANAVDSPWKLADYLRAPRECAADLAAAASANSDVNRIEDPGPVDPMDEAYGYVVTTEDGSKVYGVMYRRSHPVTRAAQAIDTIADDLREARRLSDEGILFLSQFAERRCVGKSTGGGVGVGRRRKRRDVL